MREELISLFCDQTVTVTGLACGTGRFPQLA